jgi:Voltage gated chloride channel
MGAVFAGIVRAPMTSVLMIFEMTQDYAVIVPLMIANLVSLFIASRLQHEPIYEALAVQDGIHLPTLETRQRHGRRQVMRVMQNAGLLLPSDITVREAWERVHSGESRTWLVTDRRGVVGVITLAKLERELAEGADKKLGELVDALAFPHVHRTRGWTWRSNAWAPTRSTYCRRTAGGEPWGCAQIGRHRQSKRCAACIWREPGLIGFRFPFHKTMAPTSTAPSAASRLLGGAPQLPNIRR